MYSEVVRLQASDAFKTEQPLLAQDRDICEHGNEPLVSIKGTIFLGMLSKVDY
jgi:hypothetical protein